jgi:hypothetical protein
MRVNILLLAGLSSLAACAYQSSPREVATTPPSVSYQVSGNDVTQANARADGYCQQYGMYANLQGVQPNGSQAVATYTCGGSRVSNAAPPYYGSTVPYNAPPAPYTATAPYGTAPTAVVRCADPLHQDLPGGTDYRGPPVYGCP